jgi:hypothetical protein
VVVLPILERYNIVSESDLADAALKIEAGQFGHTLGILSTENSAKTTPDTARAKLVN